MPGKLKGFNLGPFAVRYYRNKYGWGVTLQVGKLDLELSWFRWE